MTFPVPDISTSPPLNMTALIAELDAVVLDKSSIDCALDDYFRGEDVSGYIEHITLLLSGSTKLFAELSFDQHQKVLLLLLCRYAKSQEHSDLGLILQVLPYYISYLTANCDEKISSIFSDEVCKSVRYPLGQISHALDVRIGEFSGKDSTCERAKDDEWEYLVYLLLGIVKTQETVLMDGLVLGLQAWKQQTAANPRQLRNMIHNQGSLLCTLQQVLSDQVCVKPDEELLERFCVANADISYNRVLLGKLVLQKALNGKCVQVDVNYLASVLFNDEKVRFSEYTIEEQHTSVLLLLLCAQKTGDSKYLELLQWALPYCLQYLDTFYSATLCTALESESQYEAALVEEIKKFIYYPGDEAFLVQGSEKFNEFLAHLSLNKKLDFLAEALADWYDAEKPKSDVVAVAMRFNIELLRNTYANEFNSEELTSELLKEFYNETGDGQFCLGVLVSLFSNCKVESEVKPWLDTLAEGPVFRLFIDLVTHSNFSSTFRTKLINHFLRDGATIASLHIATHLDSILTAKQRARLNRLHNEHNQPQPDIKDDNVYERKQPEPIHKVKDQ